MISSELPEIVGMSDRVCKREGHITAQLDRSEATQEKSGFATQSVPQNCAMTAQSHDIHFNLL